MRTLEELSFETCKQMVQSEMFYLVILVDEVLHFERFRPLCCFNWQCTDPSLRTDLARRAAAL